MSWSIPSKPREGPAIELLDDESVGPVDSSLEFLRQVYRDPGQPMQRRMRAAIAALPFEHPKLAVTANIDGGPGFAARLEEAYRRSRLVASPTVIDQ